MSTSLGTLAIAANTNTTFEAPNQGVKAILIGNESGLTVTITMQSGGVQKTLYPGTVDWFSVFNGFTGNILITPTVLLNNVATFPSSSLIFDAIGLRDLEVASMYPIALPSRNTNVGNVINTVGGVATAVQNDTNVLNTSILEATVSGDVSSAVSLTNDAVFVLGDTAHKGSMNAAGTIFANGGINTNTIRDDTHGNTALDMSAGDGSVSMPKALTLQTRLNLALGSLSKISFFSGSANATGGLVNHGLGVIPDYVFITMTASAADTCSFFYNAGTMTTTQVFIFATNGVATPRTFVALAVKL